MSRMALWNMYNTTTNTSPPNPINTSPPDVQREALNLAESPSPIPPPQRSPIVSIKRERDSHDDRENPPAKRGLVRTANDLNRKSSINNNNNHHISNNNSQVTPTKVPAKSIEHSVSPAVENGASPSNSQHKQNGFDGTTILNGMQFKIISKGKKKESSNRIEEVH